jgi:hypothetical protein
MDYDKLEQLKRKELIQIVDRYYKSIKRDITPQFREYTNHELKQVIKMFQINITLI